MLFCLDVVLIVPWDREPSLGMYKNMEVNVAWMLLLKALRFMKN